MAAEERYEPNSTKKHLLIEWNEDILFAFTKKATRSWKLQMDQEIPWFWFQLIRQISNLQAQFFNWAQDPVVISEAGLNKPPLPDNKILAAIKIGYTQLNRDIVSAVANGDGKPIADATPPSMWLLACPARAE